MDVLMPQLGETVAEGKIVKWFKQAGDAVKPGENLFEIETDKTSMEVPAIAAGTLTDIRFQVGEVAKVGAVVAVIAGAGGAAPSKSAEPKLADAKPVQQTPLSSAPASAPRSAPARSHARREEREDHRSFAYPHMDPWREVRTPERNHGPARIGGRQVTPLARRLASERGIDLNRVSGSGPHGRIVAADIATAPQAGASAAVASQFYLVADVEIGRLLTMRDEAKAAEVEFSLGDFVIKAWAAALRRIDQEAATNIGLIQNVEGRRVTRVIRDVAGKSLSTIAREVREPDAGSADTRAVTAVNVLATPGIREFGAVVTPPFTSVLAIGRPRRAPVEAEDGGVRFVSQMTATLSCNAGAIDDVKGAELLAVFKSLVENPVTALI